VGAACGKAARAVLCGGRAMKRTSLPLLKRREFITLLGGAAIASPAATSAQVGRIYRVGLIFTTSPVSEMAGPDPIHPLVRSFVQGLATLGYLQGQNLLLEHRSAEGRFERFPEIIRELIASKVDAIVTVANPITQAEGGDRDRSDRHGLQRESSRTWNGAEPQSAGRKRYRARHERWR
jgi:hypothetical protein